MGAAPARQQGAASGMLARGRVIGQSMSIAIAGAVLTSYGAAAAGTELAAGRGELSAEQTRALQDTFMAGMHAAFLVCAALAPLGVVTSLVRGNQRGITSSQRQAPSPGSLAGSGFSSTW